MHLIRDAATLAATCDRTADYELYSLLSRYAGILQEFDNDLDAIIIVIEAGDTLASIEQAYGVGLVSDGRFTFPVELVTREGQWFDVLWIQSDDGSGLMMLVEVSPDTDSQLLTACEAALDQATP